jgi:hypothetical protein
MQKRRFRLESPLFYFIKTCPFCKVANQYSAIYPEISNLIKNLSLLNHIPVPGTFIIITICRNPNHIFG